MCDVLYPREIPTQKGIIARSSLITFSPLSCLDDIGGFQIAVDHAFLVSRVKSVEHDSR